MDILTLAIASVSLVLAAVAYWRSGGKQDIQVARRQIDLLRAKLKQLVEGVAQAIAAGYEASRRRLRIASERLRQLEEQAVEGLEKQVVRAQEQLGLLAEELEEAARSAVEATAAVARETEQAVAVRVHRLEARVDLLFAEAKATQAVQFASRQQFLQVEQQLEEAAELLRTARHTLRHDHAYDELLDAVRDALRQATAAVRSRAEILRSKLEHVLAETNKLVHRLESDEEGAVTSRRDLSSAKSVPEQDRDQESCCHPGIRQASVT